MITDEEEDNLDPECEICGGTGIEPNSDGIGCPYCDPEGYDNE